MVVYLSHEKTRDLNTAFSKKDFYDLSDIKYKLGTLCCRGHRAYTEDGTIFEKTILV